MKVMNRISCPSLLSRITEWMRMEEISEGYLLQALSIKLLTMKKKDLFLS